MDIEYLFNKYYQFMCKYAMTLLHDWQDCEDICQQIFVEISAKNHELRCNGEKAYLLNSVRNRCLRHLYNKKNHRRHHQKILSTAELFEAPKIPDTHKTASLDTAIESLPCKRKQVIQLYYMEGLRGKQVAQRMGLSLATVKTHLSLGLQDLRSLVIKHRVKSTNKELY